MKYSKDPVIDALIKDLVRQGCTIEKARHGHGKIRFPSGQSWGFPSTPSDHRARFNFETDIRKLLNNGAMKWPSQSNAVAATTELKVERSQPPSRFRKR